MAWTDLDDTKACVSINDIIDHYGDGPSQDKREYKISCPFHDDSDPSCSINTEKNTWYCHGACKRGGDIFTYVNLKEETPQPTSLPSRRRAAGLVDEWFGIVRKPPRRGESPAAVSEKSKEEHTASEPEEAVLSTEDEEPSADVVINPPFRFGTLKTVDTEAGIAYAASRGIPETLAREYGLAVAQRGRLKDRLVIPLYDREGILIGYAGRVLSDGEGDKYLFPSREHDFYKSHFVYNLNRVLQLEERQRQGVVVVEGFFGCLAVAAAGFPCVALMGSKLYPAQAKLLIEHFRQLLLLFDGDEAGKRCTEESLRALALRDVLDDWRSSVYVRGVLLPDRTQPDHFTSEELRTLLRFER
jgi:DNA primase